MTLVTHGHTDLLSAPYWLYEVAQEVQSSRAEAESRRLVQDELAANAAKKLGGAINRYVARLRGQV